MSQKEDNDMQLSKVYIYFIPNPKAPEKGGKFYNLYKSNKKDLKLDDLDPNMDLDIVEFVQSHEDPSFKGIGGAILKRNETIGGTSIFKPDEGKLEITPEEKSSYEKLEELNKKLSVMLDKRKEAMEAFLKSQEEMNAQITNIQEAISEIMQEKENKGKGYHK